MDNMNFTKADLIEAVVAHPDIRMTHKDIEVAVGVVLDAIVGAVQAGRHVVLRGFGTFKTVDCKERQGRNPQTGEAITIPAHKRPVCKLTFGVE